MAFREHEVFKYVARNLHGLFREEVGKIVENMERRKYIDAISKKEAEYRSVRAVVNGFLHISFFTDPLKALYVKDALLAAERLIKGSGRKSRIAITEKNLTRRQSADYVFDQEARQKGLPHKLEVTHSPSAWTSWGKKREAKKMAALFDYIHGQVDAAHVEKWEN